MLHFNINDAYSEPGTPGNANEDRVVALKDFAGRTTGLAVFDGGTSFGAPYITPALGLKEGDHPVSDASWFVDRAAKALEEQYLQASRKAARRPAQKLLQSVCEAVRAEFDALNLLHLPRKEDFHLLPLSGVSLLHLRETPQQQTVLEISQLGDAPVLVDTGAGYKRMNGNSRVEETYLPMIRKLMREGATHAEALKDMHPLIAADRARLNSGLEDRHEADGLRRAKWAEVLNLGGAGIVTVSMITARPGMSVLAMTDGFDRLRGTFHEYLTDGAMFRASQKGLQPLGDRLHELEAGDPEVTKFCRIKPSDDKSAVLAKIVQGKPIVRPPARPGRPKLSRLP